VKLYLIGHPVSQSLSPRMQNAALEHLGLVARYETLDTTPEDLETTLEQLEADPSVLGCNVTVPHKVAVYAWLLRKGRLVRSRSEIAQAVNTLFRGADGLFHGDSTDFDGAMGAIQLEAFGGDEARFLDALPSLDVAILGAGGSARSIATNLVRPWHGAKPRSVTVFARDPRKAQEVAAAAIWQKLSATSAPLTDFAAWNRDRTSLVIQTTTLGMSTGPAPEASPVPHDSLQAGQIAFDLVYKPHETPFLVHAAAQGATIVHGIGMLVGQGALSLGRWCNSLEPPRAVSHPDLVARMTRALQD
jgi:shikimate dehydrogenase